MMACNRLGEAATAILNATYPDSDYEVESDCNPWIAKAQLKEYNRVATNFGFKDFYELLAEIAKRTSERWVHFHFPYASMHDSNYD